ncbi:hypothetical protein [Mucilaginibacter pineti]|nr:hypothetical protein [Mucilaginibacter pineti]
MKKITLLLILCLLSLITNAQDQPLPATVVNLLPKGYEVLKRTSGDLNLDTYPDMIVVLNKANEKETSDVALHPKKRPLLIFIGGPGHTYRLAARSDEAVTAWIVAA